MLTDAALGGKSVHGVFCGGDLPGLLLPGEPDPGRGGHGIRGAEPGHHRRSPAERARVSARHGAAEEGAAGITGKSIS